MYSDGHTSCWCRGTLPPWSRPSKLETLDVTANSIEGSLPQDYADMNQLKELILSANQLRGCAQSILDAGGMRYVLLRHIHVCFFGVAKPAAARGQADAEHQSRGCDYLCSALPSAYAVSAILSA